ncbi:MAG: ABC transporter ATP-binding protein [Candidatus Limivicinus sp.]|jgi:iron complex transport system ATP-binding protein
MLKVENLCYHYKSGPAVLDNVSFELENGHFMAILGNNGVGKSTMLKCFNRILTPESGKILMDDLELTKLPGREIAKNVAFVSQSIPSTRMTVHDIVMLGRRPYMKWGITENDHEIVHHAMEALNISHLRGRYLSQLSGGERQKVMLARALAQEPKLLLLDEPTSSLDIQNQYQVLQIVRDICTGRGITSVVVIHDLNLALRFCDRFLLLRQGRVYRCGGREILDRQALKDVYNVSAQVMDVNGRSMVIVD